MRYFASFGYLQDIVFLPRGLRYFLFYELQPTHQVFCDEFSIHMVYVDAIGLLASYHGYRYLRCVIF